MTNPLHRKILPNQQQKLWKKISAASSPLTAHGFYLAGGTALALQVGHRQSVDFDFFSREQATTAALTPWLTSLGTYTVRDTDPNTLHMDMAQVLVSFIGAYQYPLIEPAVETRGILLASITDIALMKLHALQHRATLRDYIDLAVIFRDHIPLRSLLEKLPKKYGQSFNPLLSARALASWRDIDDELPILIDMSLADSWPKIIKKELASLSR